jgi:hypothetical protein
MAERSSREKLKHGDAHEESAEYKAWANMIQRCTNPRRSDDWPRYGGRGITFCEDWCDYSAFLAHVGRKPSPQHSLDRYPNPDGNYEPGNVRWATAKQQSANRGSSHGRSIA